LSLNEIVRAADKNCKEGNSMQTSRRNPAQNFTNVIAAQALTAISHVWVSLIIVAVANACKSLLAVI
jgi:hypothetical protein